MMKRLLLTIVISLICAGQSASKEPQSYRSMMAPLIHEAIENNPELRAFRENISSAKDTPAVAGSWENPMLGVGIMSLPVDSFRFDREAMTVKQITLGQKIPFPGKLGLREDMAKREVAISEAGYREKVNGITMEIKNACISLAYINGALRILNKNKELLKGIINIAQTKYSLGEGLQQDVLKAQLELSNMLNQIIGMETEKKRASAKLNTLLNRSVLNQIDTPVGLTLTKMDHDYDSTLAKALGHSPQLQAASEMIERAKINLSMQRLEYYPDFKLELSFGQRDIMPNLFSASVSIDIPLWFGRKEDRQVARAGHDLRAANEQYNAVKNELSYKVRDILAMLEMNDRQAGLYRDGIIPQAELSFNSTLASYRVNKVDFLTILSSLISIKQYELDHNTLIRDHERALSELEAMTGLDMY